MFIIYIWWDKVKTFEIFKIHQQMTKYGCSQFPYNTHLNSLFTGFLIFYENWKNSEMSLESNVDYL